MRGSSIFFSDMIMIMIFYFHFTFFIYFFINTLFSRIFKIFIILFEWTGITITRALLNSVSITFEQYSLFFILSFKILLIASSPSKFGMVYYIVHQQILICSYNYKQYELDFFSVRTKIKIISWRYSNTFKIIIDYGWCFC